MYANCNNCGVTPKKAHKPRKLQLHIAKCTQTAQITATSPKMPTNRKNRGCTPPDTCKPQISRLCTQKCLENRKKMPPKMPATCENCGSSAEKACKVWKSRFRIPKYTHTVKFTSLRHKLLATCKNRGCAPQNVDKLRNSRLRTQKMLPNRETRGYSPHPKPRKLHLHTADCPQIVKTALTHPKMHANHGNCGSAPQNTHKPQKLCLCTTNRWQTAKNGGYTAQNARQPQTLWLLTRKCPQTVKMVPLHPELPANCEHRGCPPQNARKLRKSQLSTSTSPKKSKPRKLRLHNPE